MNPNDKLRRCIRERNGGFAYLYFDPDFMAGLPYADRPKSLEEQMAFHAAMGNPMLHQFDLLGEVAQLHPKQQVLQEDARMVTQYLYMDTPLGRRGWRLTQPKDAAVQRVNEAEAAPVAAEEDLQLFQWFDDCVRRTDFTGFIRRTKVRVAQLKDRLIPGMFLCPPLELLYWIRREDVIYFYFDYPEAYHRAMDALLHAYEVLVEVGAACGLEYIWYGAPGGTEFLSIDMWKSAVVPTSQRIQRIAAAHGLHTHFHCCGKISRLIEAGCLNDIAPDIYETLAPPPPGDVVDVGRMRGLLGDTIITHGNLDLTFLRDATAEQVRAQALEVMEQTAGRPHILGAADSCLLPHTPLENIRALLSAVNGR